MLLESRLVSDKIVWFLIAIAYAVVAVSNDSNNLPEASVVYVKAHTIFHCIDGRL